MPYMDKWTFSGKYAEDETYSVSANGRRITRRDKEKPSSEQQQKLNEENARKKLTRLMNCNFTERDFFLTLTDRNKDTVTEAEMLKAETNFIRRYKAECERRGLPEPKRISTLGKDRKNGIHIHMIVSGDGFTRDEIEAIWGRGRAQSSFIYFEDEKNGLGGLANYFIKNHKQLGAEPGKRRWRQSMNLEKPVVPKPKIVKRVSTKQPPKPPKGYRLITWNVTVNEYTGALYRHVLYKRLE